MFPRKVLLGVSGGIAAYKSCELLRRLMDRGLNVSVVPTENALRFVGKATWEGLSGKKVHTSLWDEVSEGAHIELARGAELLIIAPATADLLARLAFGRSDDLLTATVLTVTCPVIIIPAMHHQMWRNPATESNVKTLQERGFHIMEPAHGPLNNGDVGVGRFPEIFEIIDFLGSKGLLRSDLLGKKIVVTAGGTREMIDPVRFIGNLSSGKQGIALAEAAARRGATVHLIAANIADTLLPKDSSITIDRITSTEDLGKAVSALTAFDILFMTAAVADYRPELTQARKIKRESRDGKLSLDLTENPDVLASFAREYRSREERSGAGIIVGFAAEDSTDLEAAARKLERKGVDYLFVNDVVGQPVFGSDSNGGTLVKSNGISRTFPYQPKDTLSHALLDELVQRLG